MSPEGKPKPNLPENRPNASMPETKLDAILTATRDRVASLRTQARELERRAAAAPAPRPFARALGGRDVGVIAEVKRRSPSAGAIREDLDPVAHARAYVRGGAVAVSVLTDELHFGGAVEDLGRVARAGPVPALRKDFILDVLQLLEARAAGTRYVDRSAFRARARERARCRADGGGSEQPRPGHVRGRSARGGKVAAARARRRAGSG